MNEKDLSKSLIHFQARMIAYEEILGALVVKVAGEHTLSNETRLQWIKELQESISKLRVGVLGKAGYDPEFMALDRDVTEIVDGFFKSFR